MLAKPQEQRALREQRSAQSTKHLLHRDANGFRRLLLLLTSSGDNPLPPHPPYPPASVPCTP